MNTEIKEDAYPLIPLFPLGLVLLPHMELPLHIFEERYKTMINMCLEDGQTFGIVLFDGEVIQKIGCTAEIQSVVKRFDDGRMDILTRGDRRFVIKDMDGAMLSFIIPGLEGFTPQERQPFLETTSPRRRLQKCRAALKTVIQRMQLSAEIQKAIGGNGDAKAILAKASIPTDRIVKLGT
jgi:Lon protease-like protein